MKGVTEDEEKAKKAIYRSVDDLEDE